MIIWFIQYLENIFIIVAVIFFFTVKWLCMNILWLDSTQLYDAVHIVVYVILCKSEKELLG